MLASPPGVSQTSESYVAVSNPPELETVDANNGSIVGTPLPLACVPVGLDEWFTSTSAPSELVVAEKSGTSGQCPTYNHNQVQMVDVSNDVPSSPVTLAYAPTAIVQSHDVHYALVLEPSQPQVQVFNTYTNTIVGSVALSGLTAGHQMSISMDPLGQDAYVTDSAGKMVTLAYQSTSPYWSASTPFTSGLVGPTSIAMAPGSNHTGYISDGTKVDFASMSGPSISGSITLTGTAGLAVVNQADTMLYVSMGSQIAAVSLVSPYPVSYWTCPVTSCGQLFMTHDGTVLGVTDASSGTVDLLNVTNGNVYNSVGLDGTAAWAIAAAFQRDYLLAWVVRSGSNQVAAFDPYSRSDYANVNVGTDPVAVTTSADGADAFVANDGTSNSVSVIATNLLNTNTSALIATVAVGTSPDALAVDPSGDFLLVANHGSASVTVIQVSNDTAAYTISLPALAQPNAIAFSPNGLYAYVTDAHAKNVDVLYNDTGAGQWVYQTTTGSVSTSTPEDVAVSPNGQTAYVVGQGSSAGYLYQFPITGSSGTFGTRSSYNVGSGATTVALSPEGGTAYVTNSSANTISEIALGTGTVTTINSDGGTPASISDPVGIGVSPDNGVIMASNASASTMTFFNTADDSVLGKFSFSSGSNPQAIAFSPTFDRPNDGSFVGHEQDVNPVIGATQNGLDIVDGVNTATEAYTKSIDDLSLPDIGTTLDLSQEYNSANAATNGPLGYGWSFSYGMTFTKAAAGSSSTACDITVTEDNGTTAVFYPPPTQSWTSSCPTGSASDAYQSPTWEQATLTVVSNCNGTDSCWDMTSNGTIQYLFDQTNNDLIRETDPNGRSVTLGYNTHNQLSTVTGPSGNRSFNFTWNGTGSGAEISQVSDTALRTATFAYSSGNLASVTLSASATGSTGDTQNHVWGFAYDSSHELVDWWSPDNQSSESSYPCSGSSAFNGNVVCEATQIAYTGGIVTKVGQPEWTTQCNGTSGTPYCLPITDFYFYPSFDPATGTGNVLITDPNYNAGDSNGNAVVDHYSDGLLTYKVDGYGSESNGTTPMMATAVTYSVADPFTWMPAISFDGDGNETTTLFDSSGLPLSVTDPMGRVTSYIYNKYDEVLQKTDPMGNVTSFTYDSSGNKLSETDPLGDVTSYAYNSGGERCGMLNADGYAAPNNDRLTSCPTGSAPYVTVYGYDSSGDQASTTRYDGTGNTVSNTYVTSDLYNAAGEQCASLSPDGYAAGDRLPTGCPSSGAAYETVDTSFDAFGNDLSEMAPSNSSGGTSATSYDPSGNETSIVTSGTSGTTTTTTYTPDGQKCWSAPLSYSSPSCASPQMGTGTQTTTYAYDPNGNEIGSVAPDGNNAGPACLYDTTSTYDDLGDKLTEVNPTGGTTCADMTTATTTYTYDAAGNQLTAVTPGPPGQSAVTTTSAYDADGEVCWSDVQSTPPTCGSPPTGAGTQTTSYSYNADGERTGTISADGNATSNPSNYETTTTYDAAGHQSSQTLPPPSGTGTGETTTDYYDASGNEVAVTGALGSPSTCDPVTTTGCADTTYSSYDEQRRSVAKTDTSGQTTSYTYDADGNELTVTPPTGSSTTYTYDGSDGLSTSAISSSTSTNYYDSNGNEIAVAGPGGPGTCNPLTTSGCPYTTYYTYNSANQLWTTINPDGEEQTNYYDSSGNRIAVTGPSGNTSCDPTHSTSCADTAYYTYDAAGQISEISYTDGTPTVSYAYSASGQVCWMYQGISTNACGSPPSGAATYGYDSLGQLTSITNTAGATITYSYDANSNLACVSYPNASGNTCSSTGNPIGVVRYTYNQTDQLQSIADWAGNTLTLNYNADGAQCWVSTDDPSSPSCSSPPAVTGVVTASESYDSANNISDARTTTGSSTLFDSSVGSNRNANHFITQETPTIGSTTYPSDLYAYNASDQVASGPITGSGSSNAYSYTSAGGMTTDTNAFASAAYDDAGVLCWSAASSSGSSCSSAPSGATTYSYDADGERISENPAAGNSAAYSWNTLTGELVCANNAGTTCSTSNPTSSTTIYAYDGDGLRTAATIGTTTTNFTWGTVPGPRLLSDGTLDYVYLGDDPTPIEQIGTSGSSPVVDLLLTDESGNVRGLVQLSAGAHQDQLVNYTDYDAYGNPLTQSGGSSEPGGVTTPQTALNSNWVGSTPWGFGGAYVDPTGLDYLVHRYYDPATGQFLSVDPMVQQTQSPYSYASDNPVEGTDPLGLWVHLGTEICRGSAPFVVMGISVYGDPGTEYCWDKGPGTAFVTSAQPYPVLNYIQDQTNRRVDMVNPATGKTYCFNAGYVFDLQTLGLSPTELRTQRIDEVAGSSGTQNCVGTPQGAGTSLPGGHPFTTGCPGRGGHLFAVDFQVPTPYCYNAPTKQTTYPLSRASGAELQTIFNGTAEQVIINLDNGKGEACMNEYSALNNIPPSLGQDVKSITFIPPSHNCSTT